MAPTNEEAAAGSVSAQFPSASDRRIENNVMRHNYRVLSDVEKGQMLAVKDQGLILWNLVDKLNRSDIMKPVHELEQAKAKIEEAVMWATKYITLSLAAVALLFATGCTTLHEDVKKAAPIVANVCQDLPVLAVSVRMAVNYVPDQRIKSDLTVAAMVLSEAQKLCPPVPTATP
jgi:hypothetical protein